MEINKFVGYNDKKCKVNFNSVTAEVRQAKPDSLKVILMTINRFERSIKMDEIMSSIKIEASQLVRIRLPKKRCEDSGANSPDAIIQHALSKTKKNWFPFVLELVNAPDIGFVVEDAENRDILLHELNACCGNTNKDLTKLGLRENVMPLIEPGEAFQAYMTSLRVIPVPHKLLLYLKISADAKYWNLETIMTTSRRDGITYIRDGEQCYFSETLRHELSITDGELTNGEGIECSVTIDFQRELVRFKKPEDVYEGSLAKAMGFDRKKDISFSEVLEVRLLMADGFKNERYNTKFQVVTLKQSKVFKFQAKNEKE